MNIYLRFKHVLINNAAIFVIDTNSKMSPVDGPNIFALPADGDDDELQIVFCILSSF